MLASVTLLLILPRLGKIGLTISACLTTESAGSRIARLRATCQSRQRDLPAVEFAHAFKRINLPRRLIRTDAHNSRKSKRKSAFVTFGELNVVEGHLQNDFRLHDSPESPVFQRVRQKIVRKLANLGVRESGVGLADVEQTIAFAHRKRVVGE